MKDNKEMAYTINRKVIISKETYRLADGNYLLCIKVLFYI